MHFANLRQDRLIFAIQYPFDFWWYHWFDLLTQVGASLCLKDNVIKKGAVGKENFYHRCPDVNHTIDCTGMVDIDAPPAVGSVFLKILKDRDKAFAHPNEPLPINTSVTATIRTLISSTLKSSAFLRTV